MSIEDRVKETLAWLNARSSPATKQGMARYAIPSTNALGVAVKDIKALGKQLGRDQELAAALWNTGIYEARMLTAFVGDPRRLSAAQMDRWCNDFDSWAICDMLCFNLFDRSPHAWAKVDKWSRSEEEFVKRAAFALIWSLSLHDKTAPDQPFLHALRLIEGASDDDRNFVKKAVNMALRAIGKRNQALRAAASETAGRLAACSTNAATRWIGKNAFAELTKSPTR